ncbi:hypothetical protein K3495_g15177 [Podosphaera aphanis]|nr:hypothetical protein K3495_g15177 [Podosphaera aphanis]
MISGYAYPTVPRVTGQARVPRNPPPAISYIVGESPGAPSWPEGIDETEPTDLSSDNFCCITCYDPSIIARDEDRVLYRIVNDTIQRGPGSHATDFVLVAFASSTTMMHDSGRWV